MWDFMVSVFPPYKNYQASTTREIPLVMMKPVEAIGLFQADSLIQVDSVTHYVI